MLDINPHINDQDFTEIGSTLLSSADRLKHSVVNTRPRRHFCNRNNGKYVDRRSNSITIGQKIRNKLFKTRVSIVYLQFKFDETQNGYFTQTMVFLAGVELKKSTPALKD